MVTGSCFCGTVKYEASGPFNQMMSCHCSMCRKHHGSAFATYVSSSSDSFRWTAGEDAIKTDAPLVVASLQAPAGSNP